ncbi:putative receptor-type adenylate cyclase [Trypanosoma cruzi]|uniref:adenylate cyclase n=1 Tax=Trypanosoma cruzi TaxID=5693 RepID=A0A2V2XFG8_TRYCR|nr:putative receptor-type adenylate cyclase [Trypanosoma cruzi]
MAVGGWVAAWPREGHACAAVAGLVVALLLLFVPQVVVPKPVVCETNVKVLTLNVTDIPNDRNFADSFGAGLEAALWWRNFTVADGVHVEIVRKVTTMLTSGTVIEKALKADSNILLVAGVIGDMTAAISLPVLVRHGLVSFAPFTGSSLVRGWNPNMYFLRAEPAAELLALLRYALAHLRVHRLGFMYLKGVFFGEREYAQAQRVMSGMGYNLSGVFGLKSSMSHGAKKEVFDAAWEVFANTRPQAVIVFGSPIKDTKKFVERMLTDKRTAGTYLLAPSALQGLVLGVWRAAVTSGVEFEPGQVLTTGTNPLAKVTKYKAIQRFQEVMRAYLAHRNDTQSGVGKDFPDDDNEGEVMVAGWVTGELLSQALGNREWVKDRTSFLASLYNQRRYVVDDIVIGDYGGECDYTAALKGASFHCNDGGRTVYIKRFVEGFRAEDVAAGAFTLRLWECGAADTMLHAPLNGLAVTMQDSVDAALAMSSILAGVDAAKKPQGQYDGNTVTFLTLNTSTAGASDTLLTEMKARRVQFVSGVVTDAMLEVESVTFIDPLLLGSRLNRFRRNVIRLMPTLEQQFFVLANYLGDTSHGSAHAVIRSGEASAMADLLRWSLLTFGCSLAPARLLAGGDALVDHLPVKGDVFLVGLAAGDAGAIARHVASHVGVRVFVVFSEFALLYAEFVAAFHGCEGADRVVFATSLPHWNDENSTSVTTKKFVVAVPEKKRTPLSLMGFAAMGLMEVVISRMDSVSAELLADFFYKNVAVTVDDMLYGPFADGRACASTESGAGCGVNYGAKRISVWPLARALDPAVPLLFHAVNPSMKYVESAAGGLTARQLIGVIVGGVAAALLFVAVVLYFCRDSRNNANAPKNRIHPVTLVFTDIESSTALWAECPEVMPDAVATHHRLIRSLVAKYRCYEVKTIGDSFMIACRSVFAAVQLVGELQQVFLQHDWGTSVIDDTYRMFEEGRAEEEGEYVPPTARLDAAVYRQYWNGLRVRVGVHTGLCDIRRDEVTKGYDYYGETSNTAARTESIVNGGQVLLTRASYFALSTAERKHVEVTALGGVALRGVPKPVEMYQLDAVPGRTFAALRLEREMPVMEEVSDVASGDGSGSTIRGGPSGYVASVLGVLFGTFAAPQRLKALLPLCQRWSVPVPSGAGAGRDKEACRAAMERLAAKVCGVIEKRAYGTSFEEGLRTLSLSDNAFFWNECGLRSRNSAFERNGLPVDFRRRSLLHQASLSTAGEAWPAEEDPVATIHVRRPV